MATVASQEATINRLQATTASLEASLVQLRNQKAVQSQQSVVISSSSTGTSANVVPGVDSTAETDVVTDLRAQLRRLQNAIAETKASEQKR